MHGDSADEARQLGAEVERLRRRVAELERLADADTLTPLLNRRAFMRALDRAVAAADRHATPAVLMFADIDRLKRVNDSWGHASGDAVLLHVAAVLLREVRTTDTVARIGGDEFGLLLTHLDAEAAAAKAQSLARAVGEGTPRLPDGMPIPVRISIGWTAIRSGDTAGQLLSHADGHMYEARAQRSDR